MMNKTCYIPAIADEKFSVLLCTMVKSVQLLKDNISYKVFIIDAGISKKSKNKILESCIDSKFEIEFIKLKRRIFKQTVPYYNEFCMIPLYHKLILPLLLPSYVNKFVYLDCDIIVKDSLFELWDTNLDHFPLAAVLDHHIKIFNNSWGGIVNYKELGCEGNSPYFNSGVMLINRKTWIKNNYTEKAFELLHNNKKYIKWCDQYAFNVLFHNNWKQLDRKFNYYDSMGTDECSILHFTNRKPDRMDYTGNNKLIFMEVLKQTKFKNFKPDTSMKITKKIERILIKIGII